MLDENLPAFFLKTSTTGIKHHREFYHSYHGSDPAPAYNLHYADPASPSPAHKNCYAAALFDAYNPEVLFGEVLARPGWSQPTLSQEEVRRQGGVPPPPQPSLPNDVTIQLYNPDLQVTLEVKTKWSSSDSYEFSIPEEVFRMPSGSVLDKSQSDPASLEVTPRVNFVWRKESRMGKDLTCFMTGKSTDNTKKKSSRKDPDIAVALWRNMRELTIYEPNLSRMDMEDPKGLEVTLLLSAVVIKDLYFSSKEHWPDLFNISDAAAAGGRKLSGGGTGRKLSNSNRPVSALPAGVPATPNEIKRSSLPRLQTTPPNQATQYPPGHQYAQHAQQAPPPADPRAQWELDAETARLQAAEAAAARELARQRRDRERADEAERKRLQRMVEQEEKEVRRRQVEVEKETERLRRVYGVTPLPPQQQQRPPMQPPRPGVGSNGLYVQPSASSSAVMMSGGNGYGNGNFGASSSSSLGVPGQRPAKKKSSFFGLRGASEDGPQQRTVVRKGSALW